jgi:hypothetical protein
VPTIEFHGYDAAQQRLLAERLREAFTDLDFREDIVFVLDSEPTSRVESWSGRAAPFVRLHSRVAGRLEKLVDRAVRYSDVETVIIGFHERRSD